jgi:hypothetical protein
MAYRILSIIVITTAACSQTSDGDASVAYDTVQHATAWALTAASAQSPGSTLSAVGVGCASSGGVAVTGTIDNVNPDPSQPNYNLTFQFVGCTGDFAVDPGALTGDSAELDGDLMATGVVDAAGYTEAISGSFDFNTGTDGASCDVDVTWVPLLPPGREDASGTICGADVARLAFPY